MTAVSMQVMAKGGDERFGVLFVCLGKQHHQTYPDGDDVLNTKVQINAAGIGV